jgi:methyl coenzyme M reductase beta subunit
MRITGKAIQPIQSATVVHSILYRGDFIGTATPSSAIQVLSDEAVKLAGTHADFKDVVTWKRNPNARLWNPTTAAIPGANQFSWVCASPAAPPLSTATTYYAVVVEWEVEFRGSQ